MTKDDHRVVIQFFDVGEKISCFSCSIPQ